MPIAASMSLLQSQINNAMNMGNAANSSLTALTISTAVGSAVPMGLFPSAPAPIPLTPAGLAAGQSMINMAFNLKLGASVDIVSQMIANGISVIASLAPPSGLSGLQSQIKNALSMGNGANPNIISTQLASAIVQYYTAGGII